MQMVIPMQHLIMKIRMPLKLFQEYGTVDDPAYTYLRFIPVWLRQATIRRLRPAYLSIPERRASRPPRSSCAKIYTAETEGWVQEL